MTKLLNIDANAKTVKGQKRGYMTAVLYLAPFKSAGVNVCPMAELAGCWRGCLNTAGRGGISKGSAKMNPHGIELPDNAIQNARIKRTRFYADDRDAFMLQLDKEITAFIAKAERAKLIPVVRLNGTSDIQWERVPVPTGYGDSWDGGYYANIFALHAVQFYDYTKIGKRFKSELPANYHLTLSFSAASARYAQMCFDTVKFSGCNLTVVVRDKATKQTMLENGTWMGYETVDGDAHDLRFTDSDAGQRLAVLLTAKGNARKDESGFIIDLD